MASRISSQPSFEIDTKGKCLLCFNPDTEKFTGHDNDSTEKYFKMFLRYLKVDLAQLTKFNSSFQHVLEGSGNVNLSLSLCEKCFSVTHEFFEYFQDFERIRMQLDNCVRKVQEFIENGEMDVDLVREYRERVNSRDPKDRVNASFAENLRKETLEKCHVKLGLSIPKVLLKAANSSKRRCQSQNDDMTIPTPIKIEQADTGPIDEIDSPEDHWKNEDDDNSSSADSEPEKKRQRTKKKNKCIVTPFKCPHCQTYYSGAPQLRKHLMKYHPKTFFAERVPKNVSEQDLLSAVDKLIGEMDVTSYYGKHNEPYFQCSWCVRKNEKSSMKAHLFTLHFQNVLHATGKVTHVPGEPEVFNCDICGQSATTYRGLRAHKSRTHGKCFPSNPTIRDLRPHQFDDVSIKVVKVEEAGSSISNKDSSIRRKRLGVNMRNATAKTPWKCEHCGCYYSGPGQLRTHLISQHTKAFFGDRIPENVSETDLVVAVDKFIWKMKTTHYYHCNGYQEPFYQCSWCSRKFDRKTMRAHVFRLHLEVVLEATDKIEKTYAKNDHLECDICGVRANTCAGLSRHKSRIHLKHFKCCVCKSEFLKDESLKYHQLQCKPQQPGPPLNSRGTGPSSGVQVVIERDSDCDVEIKKEPNCNFEVSNNIDEEDSRAVPLDVKQEVNMQPKLQLTPPDEIEVDLVLEEDFVSDHDPGPDPLTI